MKESMKTLIIMASCVIASVLIILTAYQQQEATAQTIVDGILIKMILVFEMQGTNEAQVKNYFINNIEPELQNIIVTKMNNNFDPGWKIDYKLKVTSYVNANGKVQYEIYPKLVVSGVTNLTPQQLKTGFDSTLTDMKNVVKPHLQTFNAENIRFKVYFSGGNVWET